MNVCTVEGCLKPHKARHLCENHYRQALYKMKRKPESEFLRRPDGHGHVHHSGYIVIKKNGVRRFLHNIIAEKALGKSLPKKSVVHHVNGNRSDNRNENLVICPNQSYHALIHKRQKEIFGR